MKKKITIGSRGSKLALLYAQKVKEKIIEVTNFINQDINIDSLIALAHKKGLMILKANINTVRFSPSLIIEDGLIEKGLGIFESSILDLLKK